MKPLNALTRKLAPGATRMIRVDHAHALAQFHKLTPDTTAVVHGATVRSLCAALEIHAQLEEEIFYPALRAANVLPATLDESVPAHDEIHELIARVRSETTREAQDAALGELMNVVMHHMADEETQLLPAAERALGPDRMAELGARMTSRRLELAKPRAGELARDLAMAAPGKTALLAVGAVLAGSVLMGVLRGQRSARLPV